MLLGGQRLGRAAAAVPDLPRGQLHRGDRRHALPADRRAQVRQADPRPGGAARRPSLEDGRKAVLISMDSTLRSNLSVGMPLDLLTIRRNEYRVATRERIEAGDPTFAAMSEAWSKALRDGFASLLVTRWRRRRHAGRGLALTVSPPGTSRHTPASQVPWHSYWHETLSSRRGAPPTGGVKPDSADEVRFRRREAAKAADRPAPAEREPLRLPEAGAPPRDTLVMDADPVADRRAPCRAGVRRPASRSRPASPSRSSRPGSGRR